MKKFLSVFLAVVLALSSGAMAFAELEVSTGAKDYENSWAKNEISYMAEKGIVNGYPDGTFRPTNNMSKAEFYTVINRLMGYSEKAEVGYEDIDLNDWYYSEIQKAIKANYLPAGKLLNAKENITRGEVAQIIGNVFGIEEDNIAANKFVDSASLPKKIKGIIGGLKKNGYIDGYPDGTFRSESKISRAEVVKMLHNISGEIVNEAGTISKDVKTNLLVNTADVILKDMTIDGNLYLTEGIGEGDVTLDNVEVKGELSIKGGGENSIKIKNSKLNKVSVDKQQGLVRVVFENTTAEEVKTAKETKIQLTAGTKIKIVELDGKTEVLVEKGAAIVTIDAVSNEVVIESEGTIESIKTTADVKVNGQTVKANTEVKVEEGTSSTVVTPGEEEVTPPIIGGGGSWTPNPKPTPVEEGKATATASLSKFPLNADGSENAFFGNVSVNLNLNHEGYGYEDITALKIELFNDDTRLATNTLRVFDYSGNVISSPFLTGRTADLEQYAWIRGAYKLDDYIPTAEELPTKVVATYTIGGTIYVSESTVSITAPDRLVKNSADLKAAIDNEKRKEILVSGTIASESDYTIYNVDRAVTIKGVNNGDNQAKIYGTFIVKADDVTIDNLAIQNKGDLDGESSANRGAIYLYADSGTITNNYITNGLDGNTGLSNGIQIMRKSTQINTNLNDYVIKGNTLVGHAQGVPNWSSSGIVVTENNSSGTAGGPYYGIKVDDYAIATENIFTNNKIDYVHQDWESSGTKGTTKYSLVSNAQQLQKEIENAREGATILVSGAMGSANDNNYTVYTVDKKVTIKGVNNGDNQAKIYGTFIVKADDVTIDNLAIQNKGDLTGESSTNRGGIYVFANNVTLTNNTITNGLGENAGLSNAIQIMSPTADNELSNYVITGNKLKGHYQGVPNWSSSGIVIAQGYKPGSIGEDVLAITAELVNYQSLLDNNTFTNNKIDVQHQDWKADPVVIYPYAITGLTISGEAKVGETLTATIEPEAATATYQWQRLVDDKWTAIDGATSSTYTITNDDAGHQLNVRADGKEHYATWWWTSASTQVQDQGQENGD